MIADPCNQTIRGLEGRGVNDVGAAAEAQSAEEAAIGRSSRAARGELRDTRWLCPCQKVIAGAGARPALFASPSRQAHVIRDLLKL